MKIKTSVKTLFTRPITSDKADRRWGRILVFVVGFSLPIPFLRKLIVMHLTATQWMFSGLAVSTLILEVISYGLLFSLDQPTGWSRFRTNVYQIILYLIFGLVFVLGTWKLLSAAPSEIEVSLGFILLADVIMGGTFVGTLFGIVRSSKAQQDKSAIAPK